MGYSVSKVLRGGVPQAAQVDLSRYARPAKEILAKQIFARKTLTTAIQCLESLRLGLSRWLHQWNNPGKSHKFSNLAQNLKGGGSEN